MKTRILELTIKLVIFFTVLVMSLILLDKFTNMFRILDDNIYLFECSAKDAYCKNLNKQGKYYFNWDGNNLCQTKK